MVKRKAPGQLKKKYIMGTSHHEKNNPREGREPQSRAKGKGRKGLINYISSKTLIK